MLSFDDRFSQDHGPLAWPAWPLFLAMASLVLLYVALLFFKPVPIADEQGQHLHAIKQFYEGNWRWPAYLPMLPAYHALVAVVAKIFGARLSVLRAVSLICGVVAVLLYRFGGRGSAAAERFDGQKLLLFAWLPIMFPYWGLVYTEGLSLVLIVGGLCLHERGRYVGSALALGAACLVRQSNLAWVGLLAWLAMCAMRRRNSVATLAAAKKIWLHVVIVAVGLSLFIWIGRFTVAPVEANRIRFNPAQYYLLALFVLVLWAPIWIEYSRAGWSALGQRSRCHPALAGLVTVTVIALCVVLVTVFDNPHPWNQTRGFVRNWPLLAMAQGIGPRCGLVVLFVAACPAMGYFLSKQGCRTELLSVLVVSLVFLGFHSLAEPRYYIVPAVLTNHYAAYSRLGSRRLVKWYALLAGAISCFVVMRGGPDGGIW